MNKDVIFLNVQPEIYCQSVETSRANCCYKQKEKRNLNLYCNDDKKYLVYKIKYKIKTLRVTFQTTDKMAANTQDKLHPKIWATLNTLN